MSAAPQQPLCSIWAAAICGPTSATPIAAPQKHRDWPFATRVGNLQPVSHILYFHAVCAAHAAALLDEPPTELRIRLAAETVMPLTLHTGVVSQFTTGEEGALLSNLRG